MTEQVSIAALNALLVGHELLECMDAIKETSLYKNRLKYGLNIVLPELEAHVNRSEIFYGHEKDMFELIEHKKELMKKIALFRPEYKAGFNEIINQFINAPELTMHRLGIGIKK